MTAIQYTYIPVSYDSNPVYIYTGIYVYSSTYLLSLDLILYYFWYCSLKSKDTGMYTDYIIYLTGIRRVRVMVLSATFNNISAIS
jgi:hypothetical protein